MRNKSRKKFGGARELKRSREEEYVRKRKKKRKRRKG